VAREAASWLDQNPGGTISVLPMAASRGYGGLAIFTQLLEERGLVQGSNIIAAPGQVRVVSPILFDPVATGIGGNITLASNVENFTNFIASDELRQSWKGVDLLSDPRARNFFKPGDHGDVINFYDQGLGAIVLEQTVALVHEYGVPTVDIPAERQFNPTRPVVRHGEGDKWDEYSGPRVFESRAQAPTTQTFDDGSAITSYRDALGRDFVSTRSAVENGAYEVVSTVREPISGALLSKTTMQVSSSALAITTDRNGDGQADFVETQSLVSDGSIIKQVQNLEVRSPQPFWRSETTLRGVDGIETISRDNNGDGTPEFAKTIQRFDDGTKLYTFELLDGNGAANTHVIFTADSRGAVTDVRVLRINGTDTSPQVSSELGKLFLDSFGSDGLHAFREPGASILKIIDAFDPLSPANQTSGATTNPLTVDNPWDNATATQSNPQDPNNTTAVDQGRITDEASMSAQVVNHAQDRADELMGAFVGDDDQPAHNALTGTTARLAQTDASAELVWDAVTAADAAHGAAATTGTFADVPPVTIDPLVLDLNGDGVRLTSYKDRAVFFDIDHDGAKEQTGWVAPNTISTGTVPAVNTDGILVMDRTDAGVVGVIDDVSETLSEYFFNRAAGTGPYADGLIALNSLDTADRQLVTLNSNDTAAWTSLRVWIDDTPTACRSRT
jgi:hypothetical protein